MYVVAQWEVTGNGEVINFLLTFTLKMFRIDEHGIVRLFGTFFTLFQSSLHN